MTGPHDAAHPPEPDVSGFSDSLADWAAELADRLQAGEHLDLEAYVRAHPERVERLRRLLPTIAMMADVPPPPGWSSEAIARSQEGLPRGMPEVLGDFKILGEIGRGGMGVVYEAVQLTLNRKVALKVLPRDATLDTRHLQRFQVEAQAVASLDHPNIVPIYSIGHDQGVPYYAMRLIDGPNLADIVRELRLMQRQERIDRNDGTWMSTVFRSLAGGWSTLGLGGTRKIPPAWAQTSESPSNFTDRNRAEPDATNSTSPSQGFIHAAARFARQVAEALAHTHDLGVVHRDIKPANLLVDAEGHLWVTDFGVARLQGDSELTRTGDLIGTLRYMSPEQALGRRDLLDHRTDIYSLGATLYELLTFRPAFEGDDRQELLHRITEEGMLPPRRLNPAIPPDLEMIVRKSMAKVPGDRYATARELADDLKRFLAAKPIRARPLGRLKLLRRWCRRPERAREAGVALVSLGVLMCAIGALTYVSGLVGLVVPTRRDDFILDLVVALVVFDLPPIWCGIRTLAGKRYGLWLGLITTLHFLGWLLVSLFGGPVLDYGGLYEDLSSRAPFVLLIMLLVVYTLVRVAIGLVATTRPTIGRTQSGGGFASWDIDTTGSSKDREMQGRSNRA